MRILLIVTSLLCVVGEAPGCSAFTENGEQKALNVMDFGAVPNDNIDDTEGIQACLDRAAPENKACYLPKGNYIISADLWLHDASILVGQGEESVLTFSGGMIRAEKANSRKFYYTSNYNKEIVPVNNLLGTLSSASKQGEDCIKLKLNADSYPEEGDLVYLFNGKRDTWEILEDKNRQELWNKGSELDIFAQGGVYKVLEISGTKLRFDRPFQNSFPAGTLVYRHVGAKNIVLKNFCIVNNEEKYALLFEQPVNAIIEKITIKGNGGINLSQKAFKCRISDCKIYTTTNRAILIESFSSHNEVVNNYIEYVTGGDAAVMALLSSNNNIFRGNTIVCKGEASKNEGGITIHALCQNNEVTRNLITGASSGLAVHYNASNNHFRNNVVKNSRIGILSYFANNNLFVDNQIEINSRRKGNTVGALMFQSDGNTIDSNRISGNYTFGIQIHNSNDIIFRNNRLQKSQKGYSYGVMYINSDKKDVKMSGNTFKNIQHITN